MAVIEVPEATGLVAGQEVPAPSPAVAPPPGNPRFPLFDGLRGMAVLAVLVFHVFELTGQVGFGFMGRLAEVAATGGVITFFVISGFLLYRPYVAARALGRAMPSTLRYGRRRALRILPAYWLALTVLGLFPGIAGVFSGSWWRYYGYLQLYWSQSRGGGIPVAWTLCIEVSFYVALPAWALLMRQMPRGQPRVGARDLLRLELIPLALVFAIGMVVQVAADDRRIPSLIGLSLPGECAWFAIGMGLAVASVLAEHDQSLLRAVRRAADFPELCWAGAAAAYGGLMALVPHGGLFGLIATVQTSQPASSTVPKLTLEVVFVSLLVLPAVFGRGRRGIPRRILALPPLAGLGVISYSFYLWHLTLAELIALPRMPQAFSSSGLDLLGHLHGARALILYLATLAATVVVAWLSYRLVELPFLRRKER